MTRTAQNETDNKSRGAIAVEFALVAPLLLALITGVVEFANIFNSQISVTQAAREAARTMAVKNSQADAKSAAVNGAPGLNSSSFGYSFFCGYLHPRRDGQSDNFLPCAHLDRTLRQRLQRQWSRSHAMQRLGSLSESREKGAAGVLVAVMMLVLIGAGALAVDTGQIYAERAQLQNGADAGALAAVDICSVVGGCSQADATTLASSLADSNSNDGKSTVQSVDLSIAGQVTVTTSTKDGATNAGFLTKMFASVLSAPPATVGATATAKWLYPTKGTTVLPIAFAGCEFKDDGLAHKILIQGGAQDCNGLNPSNQIIPGGFAWLAPDGNLGCKVTAEVGEWSLTSPGGAVPTGCIDLFNPTLNPSLPNSTIALPVYKYTCDGMSATQFGSCVGSTVQYYIEKWAGFKIQAWNLSGQAKYDPTNVFTGSEKGIYGTFKGFSADPSLFTGGSITPTGNVIVIGLIK